MSAKKEEPAKEAAAPAAGDAAAAPAKGMNPIVLLLIAVIASAGVGFALIQFVVMPGFKKQLAAAPLEESAEAAGHEEAAPAEHGKEEGGHGAKKGGHGEKGGESAGASNSYEFENVVVNLAGTMGTRYLKVTFLVTGKDKGLRAAFENNKPKMIDVTINVLSSLSLADLEEVGAKNIIREKLIAAYNQALDKRIAEQIYFSDFVVQ